MYGLEYLRLTIQSFESGQTENEVVKLYETSSVGESHHNAGEYTVTQSVTCGRICYVIQYCKCYSVTFV